MSEQTPSKGIEDEVPSIRWAVLLGLHLVAFVLEPVSGSSKASEAISLGLFQIAVVGALFISATPSRFRKLCLGVSALWFVASIVAVSLVPLNGLVATLSVILLVASLIATFGNLIRRGKRDLDRLLGAVFGYLLLAMVWAVLFVQIERWSPGSFVLPDQTDLWSTMIYYSLVTLTTLGYGDVLPATPLAQIAAGLEAVVGVLYIAVMVGSIVGAFSSRNGK